jgi:hypothetical protein
MRRHPVSRSGAPHAVVACGAWGILSLGGCRVVPLAQNTQLLVIPNGARDPLFSRP